MSDEHSHIHISAVGSYVSERVVTNRELASLVDTSDEWIYSHTGIRERRWAEGETTFTMAYFAVQDLLKRYPSPIDAIICATASPDYPGFPSVASQLSERLGSRGPALDVSAGCTGFIYALEVGRAMISSGLATNALVVGSEKLSPLLDMEDRSTCVLFGDGAGALLLERSEEARWLKSYIKSAGGGTSSLAIDPLRRAIRMDGRSVYAFAVRAIAETIDALLEHNNLTISAIDWIVPHQANQRIIAACAKRYAIAEEKFYMNIERYANTSAASIPLALAEMERSGLLQSGQKIILVGFGAGLTYGGTVLVWK